MLTSSSSSASAATPSPSQSAAGEAKVVSRAVSGDIDTLKVWHRQYATVLVEDMHKEHAVIRALRSDKLDYDQIEMQVQLLLSSADVAQGFCGKCRHLLNHWPVLWGPNNENMIAVGRPVHTQEIEAAAKAGCRCCAFLLSRLKVESLLDRFRKIEIRLRDLGDNGTASLSIRNIGDGQYFQDLWLNFPGKKPNPNIAYYSARCLISKPLEPTSECNQLTQSFYTK